MRSISTKLIVFLVIFALSSLCVLQTARPAAAHATISYTWTGSGNDGLWSDSRNWSPMGVPGAGDDATISVAEIITVPASTTVQSLTVSGQGTILSGGSLTITGSFNWTNYGEITTAIDIPVGATANISDPSIYQ